MKLTNKFSLPDFVVSALTRDDYDAGYASSRSITQLIDAPQVQILKKEFADEMQQDVSDLVWSRFGTGMHKVFELAADPDKYISEERLFFKHLDWNISGQIDHQEKTSDGIRCGDFKFISAWGVIYGPKIEWVNQLNGYAWLIRHAKNIDVVKLEVIAILRDWDRRKAGNNNYPDIPIQIVDIPLWDHEQQDQYMTDRIRLHQNAELESLKGTGTLPPCSDEERWTKPTTYAVKARTADGKPKKRALRVFESILEAEEFLHTKDHTHLIETRPGENTRCVQNWCMVNKFCRQFQEEEVTKNDNF